MIAEFFFGVFFNLSLWYKLTDKTMWGMWFSLLGLAVTLTLNILLVPIMGYMGCATAAFCCYGVMMIASYFVGQKKYPIRYPVGRLMLYFASAVGLWIVSVFISTGHQWVDMGIRTVMLAAWIAVMLRIEHVSPLSLIRKR